MRLYPDMPLCARRVPAYKGNIAVTWRSTPSPVPWNASLKADKHQAALVNFLFAVRL